MEETSGRRRKTNADSGTHFSEFESGTQEGRKKAPIH
jgi:hypothetical protein